MHGTKKIFFNMYKMVDISVEKYVDAEVYTITVGIRNLFLVRMHDIQKGLDVTNMSDLVRKEIYGIFETKKPTKDQIKKYKRCEKEFDKDCDSKFVYVRIDLMWKIIKNCKDEKRRGQKKRKKT